MSDGHLFFPAVCQVYLETLTKEKSELETELKKVEVAAAEARKAEASTAQALQELQERLAAQVGGLDGSNLPLRPHSPRRLCLGPDVVIALCAGGCGREACTGAGGPVAPEG